MVRKSGKSGSKPVAKASASAAASGVDFLSESTPSRRLLRENTEDETNQAMLRFRHLPSHVRTSRKVDGKLLRDKVADLIRAARGRPGKKPKPVEWATLIETYMVDTDGIDGLEGPGTDEDVRDKLVHAMALFCTPNNKERKVGTLRESSAMNLTEIVGLVNATFTAKVMTYKTFDAYILALLSHVRRHKLDITFPAVKAAIFDIVDMVHAKEFLRLKADGCKLPSSSPTKRSSGSSGMTRMSMPWSRIGTTISRMPSLSFRVS